MTWFDINRLISGHLTPYSSGGVRDVSGYQKLQGLPMRNMIAKSWLALGLACGLSVSAPVTAESSFSRFFDSDLLSTAVSVAAHTVMEEWFDDSDDSSDELTATEYDPLEKYNRMMFRFNSSLDEAALKPLAESYQEYTPAIVRAGVRNFFSNIGDVGVAANSALQGKVDQALSDSSRLALNSVVGLGGMFDVASKLDLEKNNEDFGQTLGVWGVPEGPYIVLPVLGPRTLRSAVGTAFDTYLQMETLGSMSELSGVDAVSEMVALNIVDQRTRMLGKEELLQQAALDPYIYTREAYLAYRRCQVDDCDRIQYVAADPESPSSGTDLDELELLEELEELE